MQKDHRGAERVPFLVVRTGRRGSYSWRNGQHMAVTAYVRLSAPGCFQRIMSRMRRHVLEPVSFRLTQKSLDEPSPAKCSKPDRVAFRATTTLILAPMRDDAKFNWDAPRDQRSRARKGHIGELFGGISRSPILKQSRLMAKEGIRRK